MFPALSAASPEFTSEIISSMKNDDVSSVVQQKTGLFCKLECSCFISMAYLKST